MVLMGSLRSSRFALYSTEAISPLACLATWVLEEDYRRPSGCLLHRSRTSQKHGGNPLCARAVGMRRRHNSSIRAVCHGARLSGQKVGDSTQTWARKAVAFASDAVGPVHAFGVATEQLVVRGKEPARPWILSPPNSWGCSRGPVAFRAV